MNKVTFLLILFTSLKAYGSPFLAERGIFDLTSESISNYYLEKNITYFNILHSDNNYKINKRNQFQIKDWYKRDWFKLQKEYDLSIEDFNNHYNAQTFNEAKTNYYKELDFDQKDRFHLESISFFKEWGGLNHPPIHHKIKDLTLFSKNYHPIKNNHDQFFSPTFHKQIDEISHSELSFKNKLKILEDNEAYLKKLEIIKGAKDSIFMSSLVFVCDQSTRALTEELIKKAKAGVNVYIMADQFISRALFHTECINMMKDNGIFVMMGNDFFKYEFKTIYHSKKLVVDLDKAIVGGHNMLDADNLSKGTDFKNRDIDLYVEGPLVSDIALGFIEDYQHFYIKKAKSLYRRSVQIAGKRDIVIRQQKRAYERFQKFSIATYKDKVRALINKERLNKKRGQEEYQDILSSEDQKMNGVCRFIQQSPYKDRLNIGKAYLRYLDATNNYLGIQNPIVADKLYDKRSDRPLSEFFDEFGMYLQIQDKIFEKSKTIPIDLITTGVEMTGNENIAMLNEQIRDHIKNDEMFLANYKYKSIDFWNDFFGEAHFENLINDYVSRDINVWTHVSFLHSKIFYFDRIAASIGSYNFQHNATDHSYENTIICQDHKLNKELDEVMVRDMANSVPLIFKNLK